MEKVKVQETGRYGKSLFATQDVSKGEVVYTISGSIVTMPTIYTIPVAYGKYIDDQGMGKYLCHSCEPSCGIKNHIQVVAMRDIKAGEEVTIDYAMIVLEYGNEISEPQLVCRCGASTCRGRLGSYNRLSDGLKEKYVGYISDYLITNN